MYSKINEKIVLKSAEMLRGLLKDKIADLDMAYINSDGNTGLTVSLSLKFTAGKNETMGIDAGINFVADRVKDGNSAYINPNQEELQLDESIAKRNTYLWAERMSCTPHGQAYIYYEETV